MQMKESWQREKRVPKTKAAFAIVVFVDWKINVYSQWLDNQHSYCSSMGHENRFAIFSALFLAILHTMWRAEKATSRMGNACRFSAGAALAKKKN